MSQISFNLFFLEDKRLLSEFFRKCNWFHGHHECLPKYLGWKLNFKKLRHGFVDKRATITTKVTSACHWETLAAFWLQKKRPEKAFFNTNSGLSQVRTEKQIMSFKTTLNRLFNDIWRYLIIGCFDWKICVFQQTVARVYYILNI